MWLPPTYPMFLCTLRHTTALHWLQSGVDMTVIAMWLGHEDIATTHQYIEAGLEMKQAALERMDAPSTKPVRFEAKDRLLHFLEWLGLCAVGTPLPPLRKGGRRKHSA